MDPIPENWPPSEPTAQVLPVFPLQNVWLFPYMLLPLHVFEPRYKQMMEDCLDGPGRIVLGTIRDDAEEPASGEPPFYGIAGIGEIGRHEKLPDGRFELVLVGLHRVHVRPVESDRLYRKVEVQKAEEIPVPREREDELREELTQALRERLDAEAQAEGQEADGQGAGPEPPFAQASLSHLADVLAIRMPLPHEILNELFTELDVEKRVRRALEEHARRPPEDSVDPTQN